QADYHTGHTGGRSTPFFWLSVLAPPHVKLAKCESNWKNLLELEIDMCSASARPSARGRRPPSWCSSRCGSAHTKSQFWFGSMQDIVMSDLFIGVEVEPALATLLLGSRIPGERQGL